MNIGIMSSKNTSLKGGPKAFMDRLEKELDSRGILHETDYSAWLNLSFRKIPKDVLSKNVFIVARFDGIWNDILIESQVGKVPTLFNRSYFNLRNRVLIRNCSLAAAYIFQSNYCEELCRRFLPGISANKKSTVIYNGVDLDHFSPCSRGWESEGKKTLRILVSHKMWPSKRFFQIPAIVKKLKEEGWRVRVNVLGDGVVNPLYFFSDSLLYFQSVVRSLSLDDEFIFWGHVSHDKLPDFYRDNDIMLNLSFADPCPNVVVEAMACGLPVIGPSTGGLAELVGHTFSLVDERVDPYKKYSTWRYSGFPVVNVSDYVSAIYRTLDDFGSESERVRAMAESNYNIKFVADKYIEFMQSVVPA
ncbi:MAG: glycosyltransferase family 4 protein [Pseudohongiella nitratireducens]|nr:glycosyltransferase family 4 protein [Pseudohongiella nitratireducens]